MGATLSTESTLTTVVLVGAIAVGYRQYSTNSGGGSTVTTSLGAKSKAKKKKKKATTNQDRGGASSTGAIPGQFENVPASASLEESKPQKKKPKKSGGHKTSTAGASSTNSSSPTTTTRVPKQSTTLLDTAGTWTRVKSRKETNTRATGGGEQSINDDVTTTSEAGITPSVTEEDDDEETEKLTTLTERLVPKPPKTRVDDMLPDKEPTMSRAMRFQPLPNEKPAPGFSWKDYEDVEISEGGGEGSDDADEEDDGWGVVKSKKSRPLPDHNHNTAPVVSKSPETLTKKQRQNAKKRAAQKAAKADTEAVRAATLASHKRELERTRMMEQSHSTKEGKTSGGMTPVVDARGKLVWQ